MRVVSGELGGRRLRAPPGAVTRPTSERARAALFDRLGARIEGATALDLFAGSGALGIEALSRGASAVLFVERDARALGALRANLAALGLEPRCEVRARDVRRVIRDLRAEGRRFDLVLADPPYSESWLQALVNELELAELLEPDGWLILETDRRAPPASGGGRLRPEGSRPYGETRFDWYQLEEERRP